MAILGNTKATSLTLLDGVTGNLNPTNNNVYDLGTSSLKWRNLYASTFSGALSGTASNAIQAGKLASTPNNTTTFLRGDNTWSNKLTGLLDATAFTLNGASSAGTNYITGTAGRVYFGGNFHIDSLGSNKTYINYYTANDVTMVSGSSQGKVGIGTATPNYKLDVNGTARISGPMLVGTGDAVTANGYAVSNSGSNNYIAFYGVNGDNPSSYNHTYIGESIYGSKTAVNEQSELLLFHGNDISTPSGPDRIRLLAAQVDVQTYSSVLSGTWDTIRATSGTQIANFKSGAVTITGNLNPEADNTRSLGASGTRWANVFATTFTGALKGNASSASTISASGGTTAKFWRGDNTWNNTLTDKLTVYNSGTGEANGDVYTGGIEVREYKGQTTSLEDTYKNAPGITFHWGGHAVNKLNIRKDGALYWGTTKVVTNTGTWGISITGNASTSTSASYANSLLHRGRVTTADVNPSTDSCGFRISAMLASTAMTTNHPGIEGTILTFPWDWGGYNGQLAIATTRDVPRMRIRSANTQDNGTDANPRYTPLYGAWREVVTATKDTAIGSATQPVYINNVGQVVAATSYSSYLDSNISNTIQISGMNLLPNTQTMEGWGGTENRADTPFTWCYSHTITGTTSTVDLAQNNVFTPEPDTYYTLSYWAKASTATQIVNHFYPSAIASSYNVQGRTGTGNDGYLLMDIGTTWKRYWVVYKTLSTCSGAKHIILGRLSAKDGVTLYIALPKLEKGKVPTDWTRNPGDGIHLYGRTGNTNILYNGGAGTAADYSLVLHGNSTNGSSGIGFLSSKGNTSINYPSDRAFIQYHPYGITTYTAEGTAPTLATSGEAGRFVIGVGNDAGDKIVLQAPGTTDILHQRGASQGVIPDTGNTTGTVGSATQPVYINAGTITSATYSLGSTVNAGAANRLAYYSGANAISQASSLYATTTAAAINKTSITSGYNFEVVGATRQQGDLLITPTQDATLKIYDTTNTTYGNETMAIQACFDNQDPESSTYVGTYEARCNLLLQPRGGQVYISNNISTTGNTNYSLLVSGRTLLDNTTAASTTNESSQLVVSNSNSGTVGIELWRNTNASWQLCNDSGTLYLRNNYTSTKQTTYSQNGLIMDYNTGNAAFAGTLSVGQTSRNTSYKLYVNGTANITTSVTSPSFIGNASTASKLATARTIALTGSVTGSGTFDGSGNLSIATTTNHTHSYLPLSGGTLTGAINTANGTWNKIGDDVQIGDINEAGTLGVQGLNGNTAIRFTTYNQNTKTTGGKITWDGNKFIITGGVLDTSESGIHEPLIKKTVDLSALDVNTWYPVTSDGMPYTGLKRVMVDVQLNSGTTPSWSTHNGGFTAILDLLVIAGGWGTTSAYTILLQKNFLWVTTDANPVGYQQLTNSSKVCFWLRGGGKYYIFSDFNTNWTINTASTTYSSQTVAPTTTYPGITYTKSTIGANLDGNATSAITCTGNAATATKLSTARTIQTNLASTSSASFDGSANITPGVTGTLGVANGGTGVTSLASLRDALFPVTKIIKSLQVTKTWMDVGITGTDIPTSGTYIVQVYNNVTGGGMSNYQERYSGVMSWFTTSTNSSDYDEIILHCAGHATNKNCIYLRTQRVANSASPNTIKLQIKSDVDMTAAANFEFKFRFMLD